MDGLADLEPAAVATEGGAQGCEQAQAGDARRHQGTSNGASGRRAAGSRQRRGMVVQAEDRRQGDPAGPAAVPECGAVVDRRGDRIEGRAPPGRIVEQAGKVQAGQVVPAGQPGQLDA